MAAVTWLIFLAETIEWGLIKRAIASQLNGLM
jgi:hypothetical protein